MRRHTAILISVVAFAGLAAAAEAADQPVLKAKPVTKAPPPTAASTSSGPTGFYIGINGGYDWGHASLSDATAATGMRVPSGLFGLTLGYNWQSGLFVYGLETDIDYAWMKNTNLGALPCLGCEVGLRYLGTVRGRAGYAVGSALPYVTAGLAYGGVSTSRPALGTPRDTDTKAGWTVGAGVEYAIDGPWSAKLEYLYFELDVADCAAAVCGTAVDVKVKGNLLRGGINYRF